MTSSLVGSEMCIRDSPISIAPVWKRMGLAVMVRQLRSELRLAVGPWQKACLLYTSDAADDM
eukprot:4699439-Prorocentrum_lima.AAC.1